MTNSVENLKITKVLKIERISSDSRIIFLERNFTFKAGQVIGITTRRQIPPRLYSIASGENDAEIQILYKTVPSGTLTPHLDLLKTGDSVWVSEPFGSFLGSTDPAWLICSGTGIAPYLAMIKSGQINEKILLHGSRFYENFYFADYLRYTLGTNYKQCCTGEILEGVFSGRVTDYIEKNLTPQPKYKYYLCGSAEMVVESRQILIEKGIRFSDILSEIYF